MPETGTPDWSSMVSTLLRRSLAATAGIMLIGLVGCAANQPTDKTPPWERPAAGAEATPQLQASTYAAHGELLERRGELGRAVEQYRQALALTPDLVTARNRLGVTLNKLGRHDEATAEFRRALLKTPHEAYLHNNLGFSLYLEHRYAEAERAFAEALALQPSFRRARMNHALVLARMEQYDEALEEFVQACSEADAHYNVAVIQTEAGRYAAAAHSFEQALTLNPGLTDARDQLRQIARLAAAEEEAMIAAAEAETARIAAAEAQAAQSMQTSEPETEMAQAEAEPAPPDDLRMAADIQPLAMPAGPIDADPLSPEWARVAEVFDQIQARSEGLRHVAGMPGGAAVLAAVNARVTDMFNEFLHAVETAAPWEDSCARGLEEFLCLDQVPQ